MMPAMPTPEPTIREGEPPSAAGPGPAPTSSDFAADVSLRYYPGLGGPLLLVSMGIIINCCWLFILVYRLIAWLSTDEMAQIVPGHPAYHPLLKPFMYVELLGGVIFFIFTVRLAGSYFWKKRDAPRLVIAYIIAATIFALVEYFFIQLIPWLRERVERTARAVVIYQAIVCLIWIPYFLFSRRVKGTFVH